MLTNQDKVCSPTATESQSRVWFQRVMRRRCIQLLSYQALSRVANGADVAAGRFWDGWLCSFELIDSRPRPLPTWAMCQAAIDQ